MVFQMLPRYLGGWMVFRLFPRYLGGLGLEHVGIWLEGAAHQRAPVKRLQHDREQVPRRLHERTAGQSPQYEFTLGILQPTSFMKI